MPQSIRTRSCTFLTVASLVALSLGCGGGGAGPSSAPSGGLPPLGVLEPIPDDLFPFHIASPSRTGYHFTREDTVTISGFGHGAADTMFWSVEGTAGKNAFPVAVQWSVDVPLVPGENLLTFGQKRGPAIDEFQICVVRNDAVVAIDQPRLTPDSILEGTEPDITISVYVDLLEAPSAVEVFHILTTGKPSGQPLATLFDSGDPAHADAEIDDGVFTNILRDHGLAGNLLLGVRVTYPSGEILSPPALLGLDPDTTEGEFIQSMQSLPGAREIYDAAIAAGDDHDTAAQAAVDHLRADPAVAHADRAEEGFGIWAIYNDGYGAGLLLSPPGTLGCGDHRCPGKARPSAVLFDGLVGTTFERDGATYPFDTPGPEILQTLETIPCRTLAPVSFFPNEHFSLASFKAEIAARRGIVAYHAHGDSWFKWDSPPRNPLIYSRARYEGQSRRVQLLRQFVKFRSVPVFEIEEKHTLPVIFQNHYADLRSGRIVLLHAGYDQGAPIYKFMVTPAGVSAWACVPGALVYANSCRGAYTPEMAEAWMEAGAAAFVGYDQTVASPFAQRRGRDLFSLLANGRTLGDSWTERNESGIYGARMTVFGDLDWRIPATGLDNGGFEDDVISNPGTDPNTGLPFPNHKAPLEWTTDYAQVVRRWLGIRPPEVGRCNRKMLKLLGGPLGAAHTTVCVPLGAKKLRFRYNIVSSTHNEICTRSGHSDWVFLALFGQSTIISQDPIPLCGQMVPTPINGGTADGSWHTGWKTIDYPVGGLAGQEVLLAFGASAAVDIGGTIDVLLDEVEWIYE